MKINIDTEKISKFYNKAGGVYNKIIVVVLLLTIGGLIIYSMNPSNNGLMVKTDNNVLQSSPILCDQTADKYLEKVTITDINVVKQISLINYDSEVLEGPNQKNFVPPVTKPVFSTYEKLGSCFDDNRQVVTVTLNGKTRVYPIAILDYHVVINDNFNGTPIIVVYTPVSGITKVYKSTVKTDILTFGYSGSLYKNTDLIVDYKTDTLWSVMTGTAMVGINAGAILNPIDFRIMNYAKAKVEYPLGEVMTFATGFRLNYGIDPAIDYKNNNVYYQQPTNISELVEFKELVLGFSYNNKHYAVTTSKITASGNYKATINTEDFEFHYSGGEYTVSGQNDPEVQIKLEIMYWFVWYDFYPDTIVL